MSKKRTTILSAYLTGSILSLLLVCSSTGVQGQDLETIRDQKFVTYGGGISFNNTFYTATGIENRRDPYFWQLNANLNFNFLGVVSVPFSATFSQQQKSFSQPQPFNRFGLSPKYKSLTAHLGHRSMNFSQFTLAGALFLGAGVEYQPSNNPWRASVMYGRLAKAVERASSDGLVFAQPTFKRIGYGTKIGYEKDDVSTHLILFSANDDENSIPVTDSLDLEVKPQSNFVIGFLTRFKLMKLFTFDIDFAHSMFTRDATAPETAFNNFSFSNNLGGLFTNNASSSFTNALQSKFTYQATKFQLNLAYRRIDPGFTTLGSSFLNNDLEDISGGISLPLFNNRVSLSTNLGVQRNNLEEQLNEQVVRVIFSSSAGIQVTERLNTSLSYSNFSTETQQTLIQTNLLEDSLDFFQVTRSGTLNMNYALGPEKASSLFGTVSIQDASDSDENASNFTNLNAGYSTLLYEIWRISVSGTYNQNKTQENENTSYGPVFSIGRSLFDNKVKTNFSYNLFNSLLNGQLQSRITNIRWNASSTIGKRHSVSLNAFYILRDVRTEGTSEIRELRGNVNYAFRL